MHLDSQSDETQREIVRRGRDGIVGDVVVVNEHTDPDDTVNHEVNVLLRDGNKELRGVPVAIERSGQAVVPETGDTVLIQYLGGLTDAPIVTAMLATPSDRPPLGREGHWRYEFGADRSEPLYIEAEQSDHSAGAPDTIRIARKPDGLSDPTSTIEIDDSMAEPTITVRSTGPVIVEDDDGATIEIDDGDIDMSGNDIDIGDGGSGAIYDITTTKDSDGHVTDVSVDRRSDVTL